jgi:DNA helicase-2/ATP-dependent DNA helicase PcrA
MSSKTLQNLNPEQSAAVKHADGPLMIVAGAGTGKTTVITRRIGWLIEQGLAKPDEILALTFTDKAAGEMEERVDKLLPYGYVDLWISTFHAFAERVLRDHAIDIGLSSDFKLLNSTEQWMLVRKNLARFNLDYYRPLGNPTKFIHALLKHFSRAKDELVSPADYLEHIKNLKLNNDKPNEEEAAEFSRLAEVAEAYHIYEQLLLENNAFDFGDLINRTLYLFKQRPNVLNFFRNKFKYILVDEFQDTNFAQYELIKLLAAPNNNLTVVGDDDQSIYKFRGASISNILEFERDFAGCKKIFLIKNYRSRQNILDLAYEFIQQNNPYRLEVKLGGGEGLSKKLIASASGEGTIICIKAEDSREEARLVAKKIIELKNSDPELIWNDFAVLMRANSHADLFIRTLADAGIPYQFVASRGLYAKPIILDLLAYLKLLDNYHENAAMWRVLNFSIWEIGEGDLIELNHFAKRKAKSLCEAMNDAAGFGFSPEILEKFRRISGLIEKHTALARRADIGKTLWAFLGESGYLKNIAKEDNAASRDSISHLNQFYRKVEQFRDASAEPTVKNFLEMIEMEIEAGEEGALESNPDEGPEAVKIMTAHAAKGLEFKYVFVVNLVERRFPTDERREPIELPEALVKEILPEGDVHLQEERRLFYVAMTRAKEGLFFTSAENYGGSRAKKPSRFLFELKLADGEAPPLKKSDILQEAPAGETPSRAAPAYVLPDKFSFTQLKAFESCPLQYKFQHILRLPVSGRSSFSFGQSIHLTLQRFFALAIERVGKRQADLFGGAAPKKPVVSIEELQKIYSESFIDDWFEDKNQKEEYFENGLRALKAYFESVKDDLPVPLYLEKGFNLKIGAHTFTGKIDRIDELPDGTVEIIDYKTGKSKAEEKIEKDQLLIYQLAAQNPQILDKKVSALSYLYIEDNKKVSFLGEEKELEKLKEKILGTIQEIGASAFAPTPGEFKCRHCDYKSICEFRIL